MKRAQTIPTEVLDRARRALEERRSRRAPPPPTPPRANATRLTREKIVAALKKLHPMD